MSPDRVKDSPPAAARTARVRRPGRRYDIAFLSLFALLSGYLMSYLLADPQGRYLAGNRQDCVQVQWMLAHAARLFTDGESPIFTTLLNAPHGVNLMANTSVLAIALPLAPVTVLFGPAVAAAVLLTLAPFATTSAWYYVLSRHLVGSRDRLADPNWRCALRPRIAGAVGALFAGFSPAMVSHATGHPNIVTQATLPFIVLTVLRLRIPGRAVRTGLELAGLVVVQVFINEEVLFLTALTIGLFLLALLAFRRQEVLPHVRSGMVAAAVTTGVAGTLLAYPLLHQFFGPMAYHGLPLFVLDYGADLAGFPAFATESLAGPPANIGRLSAGPTEENTFFGWPLLIGLVGLTGWLGWRKPAIRALGLTALVLAVLSLGAEITIAGDRTGLPGPWKILADLPLFDSVVPTRLAVFLTPLVAILLAVAMDAALAARRRAVRIGLAGALAGMLLPIAPTPITAADHAPVPRFFTSGAWREHVPAGATLLPIPLGWEENIDVMRWQLAADCEFATVGGYYLAPPPNAKDRRARFGPELGATVNFLNEIARTGQPAEPIDSAMVAGARREFERGGVDVLVVPLTADRAEALRTAVDQLVGPGQRVDDVWLWRL